MDNNNQLVKYQKETFFSKIKRRILNFFKGTNKITNENKVENNGISVIDINKQEFFETYEKVKRHEVDLSTLDKKTLYKIIKMLDEEIELTSKLADEKFDKIANSMNNMKMYTKEIELIRENP